MNFKDYLLCFVSGAILALTVLLGIQGNMISTYREEQLQQEETIQRLRNDLVDTQYYYDEEIYRLKAQLTAYDDVLQDILEYEYINENILQRIIELEKINEYELNDLDTFVRYNQTKGIAQLFILGDDDFIVFNIDAVPNGISVIEVYYVVNNRIEKSYDVTKFDVIEHMSLMEFSYLIQEQFEQEFETFEELHKYIEDNFNIKQEE